MAFTKSTFSGNVGAGSAAPSLYVYSSSGDNKAAASTPFEQYTIPVLLISIRSFVFLFQRILPLTIK